MSYIVAEDLVKQYGNGDALVTAVAGISFSINEGEFVSVMGESGAGKSTLVKLILGLLSPDKGTITPAAQLNIGYMPQKITIDQSLPISTSRFLQLANHSHEECHEALEMVGIGHLAKSPIQRLSARFCRDIVRDT